MQENRKGPGRPRVEELSKSQEKTLAAVKDFIRKNSVPPTMQELGAAMGVTAASAHEQVDQLVEKGYLSREKRKSRSLKVLKTPSDKPIGLVEIPILGTVAAGYPIFAEQNVIGHMTLDGSIARGQCFALVVSGESMIRAQIKPKDIVIVRQQAMAENGDIVVALVDGGATVKRLSICEEQIELRPENPRFKPIVITPDSDCRILGKVIGVRSGIKLIE